MISTPIIQRLPLEVNSIFQWFSRTQKWTLKEDWCYPLPNGLNVLIQANFVSDMASIPRVLWPLLSPTGIFLVPGVLHDYGYKYRYLVTANNKKLKTFKWYSRGEWDCLFLKVALKENDMRTKSKTVKVFMDAYTYLAWFGIRMGGWVAWNKHRKAEKEMS